MMRFEESLHADWRQVMTVKRTLYHERTGHQDLVIFESEALGRVMALDGVVQTTEADEPFYHEMLAHTPILAHGDAGRVLIIGGGDGGTLREVLRHPGVVATMVEIDGAVVELSRQWLPDHSAGAFDDPRAELVIADGLKYVAETERRFDVVIVDSTDPIGPGEVLFTEAFYRDCHRVLTERGILVTQSGNPFVQPEEVTDGYRRLTAAGFADVTFYLTAVPTYVGGFMTLGWASKDPGNREVRKPALRGRYEETGLSTRYYDPDIHKAAFALPPFIAELMRA